MNTSPNAQIETLREKLLGDLPGAHIQIEDDSWQHAGHAGATGGNMHLTITEVSEKFRGVSLIDQHRMVQQILKNEIGTLIHALILKTHTPENWRGQIPK